MTPNRRRRCLWLDVNYFGRVRVPFPFYSVKYLSKSNFETPLKRGHNRKKSERIVVAKLLFSTLDVSACTHLFVSDKRVGFISAASRTPGRRALRRPGGETSTKVSWDFVRRSGNSGRRGTSVGPLFLFSGEG